MTKLQYKRLLVKFSGEAVAGDDVHGIDPKILDHMANSVKGVQELGAEIGIVIGGGTTFLKLGQFVDGIKEELDNDEQRLGADIIKRALSYPMRLVAFNSGVNGSVTVQNVLSKNDPNYGFNAATGEFEDLMQSGIIDPTKVIRCCLENSVSVAKIFLTSDVVVCEIPEDQDEAAASGAGPMDGSGYGM